jgi:alkylation response protein AidB-like acyl-CoA dehydrogenase
MQRTVFDDEHEMFRKTVREFLQAEVVPVFDQWFAAGIVPRDFYHQLGELGLFGIEVPAEFGGAGEASYKYQAVLTEEIARAGVSLGGSLVHVALCLPYLLAHATDEQKRRWLPDFVTGKAMFAIAMTEPGTGSDLAGMCTTAALAP